MERTSCSKYINIEHYIWNKGYPSSEKVKVTVTTRATLELVEIIEARHGEREVGHISGVFTLFSAIKVVLLAFICFSQFRPCAHRATLT